MHFRALTNKNAALSVSGRHFKATDYPPLLRNVTYKPHATANVAIIMHGIESGGVEKQNVGIFRSPVIIRAPGPVRSDTVIDVVSNALPGHRPEHGALRFHILPISGRTGRGAHFRRITRFSCHIGSGIASRGHNGCRYGKPNRGRLNCDVSRPLLVRGMEPDQLASSTVQPSGMPLAPVSQVALAFLTKVPSEETPYNQALVEPEGITLAKHLT